MHHIINYSVSPPTWKHIIKKLPPIQSWLSNFSISFIANDYKQQKGGQSRCYLCMYPILPGAKVTLITHIKRASKTLPNQL